ncbi:MAG: DUF488 domain-containing protein [Sphingomonadales bacterium]|nr:MAG: DUF488 domain-containing protein [Sphingomonadales bacterium]
MDKFDVSTIGFTKTTAERFFDRLKLASVKTLIDVRLNNTSQLSGFAKANDLKFFVRELVGANYVHEPLFAPNHDMLDEYKKNKGDWLVYENKFMTLMADRRIEEKISPGIFSDACLLCSEDKPHQCHRRLVCEYLNIKWGGALRVRHL